MLESFNMDRRFLQKKKKHGLEVDYHYYIHKIKKKKKTV